MRKITGRTKRKERRTTIRTNTDVFMENGYNIGFGEGYREGFDYGQEDAYKTSDKFFSIAFVLIIALIAGIAFLFTYM